MTTVERLQAMELLWDTLIHEEPDIEPPRWHRDVLRERVRRMESSEAKFYTLEQLKERLKR